MSSTGVFIENNDPLPINAELDLNLQLPDNPEIMSANARVVWIKSPDSKDSNASAGMGMQFTNILPEQQKKLNGFIEHNLQLGHGNMQDMHYV
jgi:Tfp pilus assembly protein PilZ